MSLKRPTGKDRIKVTIDDQWKSHTRYRLVPKSTTLDNLEGSLRTVFCSEDLMGKVLATPCQEPHPRSRPFGPCLTTGVRVTDYRVCNPTNDRLQM